jgi:branched-subunit amino acid aminotransferase/4-amino-4-deoxychorismate lyase
MLDLDGFVAETNATNLFLVKKGCLFTPLPDACLPGITRGTVLQIANQLGISSMEKRLSLTDFYTADEVFTTGTMGELTPVVMIDGRIIGDNQIQKWTVFNKIQTEFRYCTANEGTLIPNNL